MKVTAHSFGSFTHFIGQCNLFNFVVHVTMTIKSYSIIYFFVYNVTYFSQQMYFTWFIQNACRIIWTKVSFLTSQILDILTLMETFVESLCNIVENSLKWKFTFQQNTHPTQPKWRISYAEWKPHNLSGSKCAKKQKKIQKQYVPLLLKNVLRLLLVVLQTKIRRDKTFSPLNCATHDSCVAHIHKINESITHQGQKKKRKSNY